MSQIFRYQKLLDEQTEHYEVDDAGPDKDLKEEGEPETLDEQAEQVEINPWEDPAVHTQKRKADIMEDNNSGKETSKIIVNNSFTDLLGLNMQNQTEVHHHM